MIDNFIYIIDRQRDYLPIAININCWQTNNILYSNFSIDFVNVRNKNNVFILIMSNYLQNKL